MKLVECELHSLGGLIVNMSKSQFGFIDQERRVFLAEKLKVLFEKGAIY